MCMLDESKTYADIYALEWIYNVNAPPQIKRVEPNKIAKTDNKKKRRGTLIDMFSISKDEGDSKSKLCTIF